MKSDACSGMNTRITALENASGGGIKTISKTTDDYGGIVLSKTTYKNLLFATPMYHASNSNYPYNYYYYIAACFPNSNNWCIQVYCINDAGTNSIKLDNNSSRIPVLIGYTN